MGSLRYIPVRPEELVASTVEEIGRGWCELEVWMEDGMGWGMGDGMALRISCFAIDVA